ncbi:MAG: thermonuclease family protein [Spirosomataceae bacterium]
MNKFREFLHVSLLSLCFIPTSTILQLCLSGVSKAQSVPSNQTVTLVRVIDGDTYLLQVGTVRQTVRLLNVDCPETDQSYGPEAGREAQRLFAGTHQITLKTNRYPDKYGRTLGHIRLDGKPMDSLLTANGYAWASRYGRYLNLRRLEQSARIRGIGLWQQKNPAPPWEWRRSTVHRLRSKY